MEEPRSILEAYSRSHPEEILIVELANPEDEIMIYKGFSSSLRFATASDPDVPLIPDGAEIRKIDRLLAPYHPQAPRYIQQNLTWMDFLQFCRG
jgi:hypothetical protein